jgi:translocation and assembly module TamB
VIRALTIVGIALAVLLAVAAAAVAWLVGTERGSRFALEQAQGFLPAGIDLGSANGRLADDLALENVTVALEGLELTIARLELRWSPGELLKGRLEISEIGAEGVRYRALPSDRPDPPDEPFLLPERLELPVSVHVERLTVDDIEIRTGPEAAPLEVTRVLLTGAAFVDSGFTLEALQVDAALGSVRGRADATAAGEYPLDVHLEWRFRPAGYAPIHGTTVLGGSLAALTLDQHLAGPYNTALAGTVSHLVDPDRTIEVALRLAAADVRLTAVQDELPDAAFSVGAEVTGPVDALDVQVDARGTDPEGNRLLATAHALVEPESVTVRQLVVRQTEHDGVLHGDGRITLAGEVAADLSIRWEALQWPLTGEPTVASPRGTLEVDGPLEAYRLDLDARLEPAGSPPVDLRVDGNGDLASASLSLGARTGDGTLEGTIDATWDPAVAGEASLRMAGFDPSAFAPDWPGSVNLAVAASARIEGDGVHVSIDRLDANGTLRDQDLSVAAGIPWTWTAWTRPSGPPGSRRGGAWTTGPTSSGDSRATIWPPSRPGPPGRSPAPVGCRARCPGYAWRRAWRRGISPTRTTVSRPSICVQMWI